MQQLADTPSNPVINVEHVWKIFGNNPNEALEAIKNNGLTKAQVLEKYNAVVGVCDVSFSVEEGEIFCIMGLSGSGKSTLVRHFNRLLDPTAGNITINGFDVVNLNDKELRDFRNQQIGMVFQNFALLPHKSVVDNVAMPLEIRGVNKNERVSIASNILKIVELDAWSSKFAHELSGGMQQRVGLARALAANPNVLLMDEPFSALDPLIRRQLQDEFIKLSAIMKKTTIFITHDLDEAVRVGNRIAILRDGEIVQIGTAEDILMNPADNYVADFVAGISRLKVVKAHSTMISYEKYIANNPEIDSNAIIVDKNETLSKLVSLAVNNSTPIVVKEHQKNIGVITRKEILQTIIEGTEI